MQRALGQLDARLVETGKWLAGDEFTAADVLTVWSVTTMRQFVSVHLGKYQGILAWLGRVADREAYRRAMDKGDQGLDWRKAMTPEGPGVFPPIQAAIDRAAAAAKDRQSKV